MSELMVLNFGRPMQLLRSEVNLFQGLTVYVRDSFLALDSVIMNVDFVKS